MVFISLSVNILLDRNNIIEVIIMSREHMKMCILNINRNLIFWNTVFKIRHMIKFVIMASRLKRVSFFM